MSELQQSVERLRQHYFIGNEVHKSPYRYLNKSTGEFHLDHDRLQGDEAKVAQAYVLAQVPQPPNVTVEPRIPQTAAEQVALLVHRLRKRFCELHGKRDWYDADAGRMIVLADVIDPLMDLNKIKSNVVNRQVKCAHLIDTATDEERKSLHFRRLQVSAEELRWVVQQIDEIFTLTTAQENPPAKET